MGDDPLLSLNDIAGSRLPLLEHAPDATVIVDAAGRMQLINAQTERLFGYYREELIGKPVEMLIPERYHGRHVGERESYYADPRVRPMGVGLELYGLRKDGSEFPVEISLSPVVTRDGTFVASAIRDVTERKTSERKLQELNTELEMAGRAKDDFLASMSHELRTPLNAIIGFTGTLLMRLPGPLNDEQERQLGIVQWSARHLLSLINDILDLAKIESGKIELHFEAVPVKEVVKDVAASLAALASEKGLEFTSSVSEDGKSAVTDRRALRQILLNLTDNAIKYTEKGSVRVDVRGTTWNDRPAIVVRVIDTGIGIKPEDRQRLFEAFEQLEPLRTRRFEGTGLGLCLCRNLAALLGGALRLTSEYGSGSTFTLFLPKLH
ncbi:MAG: ATP-binding protein [Candidatus Cybelea sp.]